MADVKEDLTGQSRFTWNLFVSWSSQLVLIFSGFVMPRLVDDKIGQVALGIWDFGWAFVNYLTLVGLGMGACFNRYIAKHRAEGNINLLNQVANSVIFVQLIITCLVSICTYCFYLIIPYAFDERLGANIDMAQYVVLFLGFSLAVQMASGSARGLLTGYHRWDIHNALHAAKSVFALCLMVGFLTLTSYGIVGMAFGYLIATVVFEFCRFYAVRIICKEFVFDLQLVSMSTCKEMLVFGIKSMLTNLPPILLLQTLSLLIVSILGPAALAIFSRPIALTKQITTFMTKFTLMLAPTTSSLQGETGNYESIKSLYLTTTKFSFAFSIPALGFLCLFGDQLLKVWMGADYALWPLIVILAVGQLLPMAQDNSIRILMGLNKHGKISLVAFGAVILSFIALLVFSLTLDWSLLIAAILFVVPLNLVYGIYIPYYTCRTIGLSIIDYISKGILSAFILTLPYLFFISLSRYLFSIQEIYFSITSFILAIIVTLIIYYFSLVPAEKRSALQAKIPKLI